MSEKLPVIAILGGTGDLGTGLARRWVQAGYQVIIGSRTADKSQAAVADLTRVMSERGIDSISAIAMDNLAAANAADICVMTVPFAHQTEMLELIKNALSGKILIDVTVPLIPPKSSQGTVARRGLCRTNFPKYFRRKCECCFSFSKCSCAPFTGRSWLKL
ncbi:MAG: NAD(P)-binding domain-containing protein [Spongiibacteraceae bacterium]